MRPRSRLTLLAALALGAAVASACSCGSQGSGGAGAGAGGSAASTSAVSTANSSTSVSTSSSPASSSGSSVDKNGCEILPYPPGVPEGWVEWTDWSCKCRFYRPGSKEVMPAPIKWEACPPAIPGCRMMVTDWTVSSAGGIALFPRFNVNHDGSAAIFFRRLTRDVADSIHYYVDLAADVDGIVRFAQMRPVDKTRSAVDMGCYPESGFYQDDRLGFGVVGDDIEDSTPSIDTGFVGGIADTAHVSLLARYRADVRYEWYGDKDSVVRADSLMRIYSMPWAMTPSTFIASTATDAENLQLGNIAISNGAIFWDSSSEFRSGISVWTSAQGERPLIRWIGDATRGAGGLGTDGIDMVWEYGEGKEPSEVKYPSHSVMTAKFSTDPDVIAASAQRLRSYPRTCLGCHPWIVACGYAANNGSYNNTMVVRLSDGWSWETPKDVYLSPFGLTCDEVFMDGNVTPGRRTIARIKLSELGPGMAPD